MCSHAFGCCSEHLSNEVTQAKMLSTGSVSFKTRSSSFNATCLCVNLCLHVFKPLWGKEATVGAQNAALLA